MSKIKILITGEPSLLGKSLIETRDRNCEIITTYVGKLAENVSNRLQKILTRNFF